MHAGVQRSTSESGRHITLDGDELCARGRGKCVCSVCVCVCVCVCVSDIERNQTYGENVCVCDGKHMLNRVFTKRLCVRDRERYAGLEVGRG